MAFTLVQVRGKYDDPAWDDPAVRKPAGGQVEFQLSGVLQDPSTNEMAFPTPKIVGLAPDGTFYTFLVATDSAGATPSGLTYRVTEKIVGAPVRTRHIEVLSAYAVSGVDLADIADAVSTPVFTYVLEDAFLTHVHGTAADNVHPGYLTDLDVAATLPELIGPASGGDDTPALTAKFGAGRPVMFNPTHQVYELYGPLNITTPGQVILAFGQDKDHGTVIKAMTADACLVFGANAYSARVLGGLYFDGNNIATHGVILNGASNGRIEGILVEKTTGQGWVFGADNNNNFCHVVDGKARYCGGHGLEALAQPDNNEVLLENFQTFQNGGSGVKWRGVGLIRTAGGDQYNVGYGMELGDAADASTTTNCKIDYPWEEGNQGFNGVADAGDGVYCSTKSARNIVQLFFDGQDMTDATVNQNARIRPTNGGYQLGTKALAIEQLATPSSSRTYIRPVSVDGSIAAAELHLNALGATGVVFVGEVGDVWIGHGGGKVGLYGGTKVVQAAAIASPTADVASLKTAVDAIRNAIKAGSGIGITA